MHLHQIIDHEALDCSIKNKSSAFSIKLLELFAAEEACDELQETVDYLYTSGEPISVQHNLQAQLTRAINECDALELECIGMAQALITHQTE